MLCIVRSNIEWLQFIRSCYSLGRINCGQKGWKATNGKKELIGDWMETSHAREKADDTNGNPNGKCRFFKYREEKFKEDNVMITVFDTVKQRRIMVDGLHRAVALTIACEDGINIYQVKYYF